MTNLIKTLIILCLSVFTLTGNLYAQEKVSKKEKAPKKEKVSKQAVKVEDKAPKTPQITFESLEYDYGTIKVGGNGECVFTFTNTGKEPLVVSKVQGCCGVTVMDWTKEPVEWKDSGKITLRYSTKRQMMISKTVTVLCNDPEQPELKLILKGRIVADDDTNVNKSATEATE